MFEFVVHAMAVKALEALWVVAVAEVDFVQGAEFVVCGLMLLEVE